MNPDENFYPSIPIPSTGSNNAQITVKFGKLTAGPITFKDYSVDSDAANWVNKPHPFGARDPVQTFADLTGIAAVPEPSTIALMLIGALFVSRRAATRFQR
jgi:hypothetical protein